LFADAVALSCLFHYYFIIISRRQQPFPTGWLGRPAGRGCLLAEPRPLSATLAAVARFCLPVIRMS